MSIMSMPMHEVCMFTVDLLICIWMDSALYLLYDVISNLAFGLWFSIGFRALDLKLGHFMIRIGWNLKPSFLVYYSQFFNKSLRVFPLCRDLWHRLVLHCLSHFHVLWKITEFLLCGVLQQVGLVDYDGDSDEDDPGEDCGERLDSEDSPATKRAKLS